MIYQPHNLQAVLAFVHERLPQAINLPTIVEGSIAEGFANSSSDIDIMIILNDHNQHLSMPITFYYKETRIEVRFRSVEQISQDIIRIQQQAKVDLTQLKEIELDKLQRFLNSSVLVHDPIIDQLKALLTYKDFGILLLQWYKQRIEQYVYFGHILLQLNELNSAQQYLKLATAEAAKAALCYKNELYINRKWLFHQLNRAKFGPRLIQQLTEVQFGQQRFNEEHFQQIFGLLKIDWPEFDDSALLIQQGEGSSYWQLDGLHYLIYADHIFEVSEQLATIWQALKENKSLATLQQEVATQIPIQSEHLILLLDKLKLIQFQHHNQIIQGINSYFNLPVSQQVDKLFVSALQTSQHITRLPFSAKSFAYAGVSHHYINLTIENIKDDLKGGETSGHWQFCEQRLREMLRQTCFLTWCAWVLTPPPPLEEKWDDAILGFQLLPDIPELLKQELATISQFSIRHHNDLIQTKAKLYRFVDQVREFIGSQVFQQEVYVSKSAIETAYLEGLSWMQLAKTIQAPFPVIEVKDLVEMVTQAGDIKSKIY